ncbi:MAG: gamma-glutamylcyclotransferase family protein [Bdellovibrionota bacterium]|nr:gamma-glutamylcyclotransferase family protein [Bdellovibrionota bacterium]
MDYFFFYGTLLDPDVFSTVLLKGQDELFESDLTVRGFRCFKVSGESFPVLLPCSNSEAKGKIFRIPQSLPGRLNFFEDVGRDFDIQSFNFFHNNCKIYYFSPTSKLKISKTNWSFEEFQKVKLDYVKSCFELMKEIK